MRFLKTAYGWLIRRPSYVLLTASDASLAAKAPERFAHAWWGVMLLSLFSGLLLVHVWGLAWMLFQDSHPLFAQAMTVLIVFVLWPFRRAVAALADVLGGSSGTSRAASAALLVVVLAMALLRIPAQPVWYWYEVQLHPALQWLRPEYDVYRVLLLMPVWGGWSMLNLGLFCRANQATEPAVRALVGGCGPVRVAVCMAVMLAATTFYFDFLFWPQLCVSGSAILAAIFGGRLICRFGGGLRRDSLLATNLLTQLAFLLAYLAVRGLGSR